MGLKQYRAKRDFKRTAEPKGKQSAPHAELIFVVQKHDASRLHYDFRLEMEGVLKSWAVPKGFPWTKGERRLAVEVEDHPFDYKDFEGIIPSGNYGAGTVMIWDFGTYAVGGGDPLAALKQGKLHLFLTGKKLKDEWTLVRIRKTDREDKPQWLLLKSGKSLRPISARADDQSALTGRKMREIADAADREWQSDRTTQTFGQQKAAADRPRTVVASTAIDLSKLPSSKPGFVEPMKAWLSPTLPKGDDWVYEIKFDGIRALAVKNKKEVRLFSRAGNDLTSKYPALKESLAALPARELVIDGEIAALDEQGRSSFQLLQSFHRTSQPPPLVFYVFDLVNLDGRSLTRLSLADRKAALEKLVSDAPQNIRYSPPLSGDVERVVREMKARGLEGLIAKKIDATYESGRRSRCWVKFKWVAEQEFVIGGYTQAKGGRNWFGALLVGYYEKGKLLFAGKVGTGFDEATLESLYKRFQKIVRVDCPFANLPEKPSGQSRGLTASQMRLCTWLEPRLVAQVKFAEWTRDNHLRQPAFMGLREDKRASEVVREQS
jgi:bifunctional non-homologous end joining protein LigD